MTNVNTLIEGAKELNLELNPEQIQKFISYKKTITGMERENQYNLYCRR